MIVAGDPRSEASIASACWPGLVREDRSLFARPRANRPRSCHRRVFVARRNSDSRFPNRHIEQLRPLALRLVSAPVLVPTCVLDRRNLSAWKHGAQRSDHLGRRPVSAMDRLWYGRAPVWQGALVQLPQSPDCDAAQIARGRLGGGALRRAARRARGSGSNGSNLSDRKHRAVQGSGRLSSWHGRPPLSQRTLVRVPTFGSTLAAWTDGSSYRLGRVQ